MFSVYIKLKEHGIFPEVIPIAPENTAFLSVSYPSGAEVNLGEEVTPMQAKRKPTVSWEADPESLYCLLFIGIPFFKDYTDL